MAPEKLISICIPSYKRIQSLYLSIDSAIRAIDYSALKSIEIYVYEDCGMSYLEFYDLCVFYSSDARVKFFRQNENKGMSRNIYDLLGKCNSRYAFILTDDDVIEIDAIQTVVDALEKYQAGIIYGPRKSYLEDGSVYTVATNTFSRVVKIDSNPLSIGRTCANFFILSGLVVDVKSIDWNLWGDNIDNAFFPMIFGGSAMMARGCLFVPQSLVKHTVKNLCHWEQWGADVQSRELRLSLDFFAALARLRSTFPLLIDKIIFELGTTNARSSHLITSIHTLLIYRKNITLECFFKRIKLMFIPCNIISLLNLPLFVCRKYFIKLTFFA